MLSLKSILTLTTFLLPTLADVTLVSCSDSACSKGVGFPKILSVNESVGIDDPFASLVIASAGSMELNNPKCSLQFYSGAGGEVGNNFIALSPISRANGLCIVPKGGETIPANAVAAKLVCPK